MRAAERKFGFRVVELYIFPRSFRVAGSAIRPVEPLVDVVLAVAGKAIPRQFGFSYRFRVAGGAGDRRVTAKERKARLRRVVK